MYGSFALRNNNRTISGKLFLWGGFIFTYFNKSSSITNYVVLRRLHWLCCFTNDTQIKQRWLRFFARPLITVHSLLTTRLIFKTKWKIVSSLTTLTTLFYKTTWNMFSSLTTLSTSIWKTTIGYSFINDYAYFQSRLRENLSSTLTTLFYKSCFL